MEPSEEPYVMCCAASRPQPSPTTSRGMYLLQLVRLPPWMTPRQVRVALSVYCSPSKVFTWSKARPRCFGPSGGSWKDLEVTAADPHSEGPEAQHRCLEEVGETLRKETFALSSGLAQQHHQKKFLGMQPSRAIRTRCGEQNSPALSWLVEWSGSRGLSSRVMQVTPGDLVRARLALRLT
uniref:Uncharacterized protein n=1 Tax=Sphaerodactylus townsendi TaxID=933632 RepID=A0ACB8FM67_9SAUR